MLGFSSVVGSMLIDGVGAVGVPIGEEPAGRPVSGPAIPAVQLVSVRTGGIVRRQSPRIPRLIIPAIRAAALRWDLARGRRPVARPTEREGSDRRRRGWR